ncbi:MAG: DUF1416 domain-containing protein, partial [Planctomycetes bacterium]|nr:DUF1416 domain-containing protein [Planctomycetota bacterium]
MSRMRKGLGMAWVSLAAFAWASVLTGLWPSGAACAAEEKVVVKGIVVGEDGQPVPGARVRAVVDRRGSAFAADLDVVTDAQGQFEAQLAPGTYRALATKGLLTSHGGPRAAQWWEVRKEEGPMEIRIPLKPGGRIMGVVVKKDGAPIEAARVSMQPVFAARTDKDGRFELEGVAAGKHYVWAQATGFGKEYVEANASGQGTAEVKIELGPEFKVRGRVTDEQGQPVSGARVLEQFVQRATADADGRYEVRGLSFNRKATSVQVEHPGFAKKQRSDVSPPKEGDVLTLDFVLDKGYTIEGEVRGPDGQPIRGARVGFNPNYFVGVPQNSTETDENGRFQ